MASRQEGGGGNLFPTLVSRLVHLSPAGVLLLFFFVLFVVYVSCFDSLRALLARLFACLFLSSFFFFFVHMQDPGF